MAVTYNDIVARLAQLGYTAEGTDLAYITFEWDKVQDYVKNYCNITTIPTLLDNRIIDQVCGAFLFNKKNSGELTGFDYDVAIKQIKEGDTSITYAVGNDGETPESRFDAMISNLQSGFNKWLTPYRQVKW